MATFSKQDIQIIYRRMAKKYDLWSKLFVLIGFREKVYRQEAVAQLQLGQGNTVVELGCGTGLNFEFLQRYIGSTGKIVGVDFSEAMLIEAKKKTNANGWHNIDLVQCDAAEYAFSQPVDGILSSFSLVFMPKYKHVIQQASQHLKQGKRLVVLDQKIPKGSLRRYTFLFEMLVKSFAVTAEMSDQRPWQLFKDYFDNVTVWEFYAGFCYLAVGETRQKKQ